MGGGIEISQGRDFREAGPAFQSLAIGPLNQSSYNIDLAFLQSDVIFDDPLADHRLGDAADAHVAGMRGDFHLQFQADVAIRVHSRRKIDIHPDILVGELSIYEGTYAAHSTGSSANANAGRKTARGDRNAIPNP